MIVKMKLIKSLAIRRRKLIMKEKKLVVSNVLSMLSVLLVMPIFIIFWYLYSKLNGKILLESYSGDLKLLIPIFLSIPTICLHELLHATGWILTGKKFKDFKFGLKAPFIAYTRYSGNMKVPCFMFGLILPFIVTSILPMIVSIFLGNVYLLFFGIIMGTGCGSDFISFIRSFFYLDYSCYDLEGEIGFVVFKVE